MMHLIKKRTFSGIKLTYTLNEAEIVDMNALMALITDTLVRAEVIEIIY